MDLEIGYLYIFESNIFDSTLLEIYIVPLRMSNIVIIEVLFKLILSVLKNNECQNLNVSHMFQK